jgi:hypothetical protein
VDPEDRPPPAPADLLDGAFERVAAVDHALDPPGNEWSFACGVLFALGSTNQLDDQQLRDYEARIQSEARRLRGDE